MTSFGEDFLGTIVSVNWGGGSKLALQFVYNWVGSETGPSWTLTTPQGTIPPNAIKSTSKISSSERIRGDTVTVVDTYSYIGEDTSGLAELFGTLTVTTVTDPDTGTSTSWGFSGTAQTDGGGEAPAFATGTGDVSSAVAYLTSATFTVGLVHMVYPNVIQNNLVSSSSSSSHNAPIYTVTATETRLYDLAVLQTLFSPAGSFEVDISTGSAPAHVTNITTKYTWSLSVQSFKTASFASFNKLPWPHPVDSKSAAGDVVVSGPRSLTSLTDFTSLGISLS